MSQSTTEKRRPARFASRARRRHDSMFAASEDQRLAEMARCAQRGPAAERNALYARYQPLLERKTASIWRRYGRSRSVDLEDLRQEAFVVFAELLIAWHGNGSFTAFLLASFWWRMRDAVDRHGPVAPREPDQDQFLPLHDGSAAAEHALSLLEQLVADMPPLERQLLLWRVRDGKSVRAIALELKIDRRTVQRTWNRATQRLREGLKT